MIYNAHVDLWYLIALINNKINVDNNFRGVRHYVLGQIRTGQGIHAFLSIGKRIELHPVLASISDTRKLHKYLTLELSKDVGDSK